MSQNTGTEQNESVEQEEIVEQDEVVKEKKKPGRKPKAQKPKVTPGVIREGFELEEGYENYVIVEQRDHSSPQAIDASHYKEPEAVIKHYHPHLFMKVFKHNFENNFVKVKTPEDVYLTMKNLNEDRVKKYYRRDYKSQTEHFDRADDEDRWMEKFISERRRLKLGRIEIELTGFLYVPTTKEDLANCEDFPEEVNR